MGIQQQAQGMQDIAAGEQRAQEAHDTQQGAAAQASTKAQLGQAQQLGDILDPTQGKPAKGRPVKRSKK